MQDVPWEIACRFEDRDEEMTIEAVIDECRYLIELIEDGGSTYNDDDDGGVSVVNECKEFLKQHTN